MKHITNLNNKTSNNTLTPLSSNYGFTIVELLVVIVVIGILAAITIISYSGISQRAIAASLESDLASAKKQLQIYQTDHDAYPVEIDDCPTPAAGNLCISQSSGDNEFTNYSANNTTNPPTFTLDAVNGDVTYRVTESTVPVAFVSTPTAATQGPLSPGTVVSNGFPGTPAWSSPDNAKVSDNSYASAALVEFDDLEGAPVDTERLYANNFNFSIPTGSTINGIKLEIEKHANIYGFTVHDGDVKLARDSLWDLSEERSVLFAPWAELDEYTVYGSDVDLWGRTWSAEQINSSDFGMIISAYQEEHNAITAYIDHVRITVYYTTP